MERGADFFVLLGFVAIFVFEVFILGCLFVYFGGLGFFGFEFSDGFGGFVCLFWLCFAIVVSLFWFGVGFFKCIYICVFNC